MLAAIVKGVTPIIVSIIAHVVLLVARFEYGLTNPNDPFCEGSQDNVQTALAGDVDGSRCGIIIICLKLK